MQYQFIKEISTQKVDEFVAHHTMCNLLQSSKWAVVKQNWDSIYCGVKDSNKKLVGVASILIKKLPFGFTMFYIPKGPVMDYDNQELVSYFMKELKTYAKSYHCLFIKMDPGIIKHQYRVEDYADIVDETAKRQVHNLISSGCIHKGYTMGLSDTIQPRFHAAVFAQDDFEANLPKHTKRHIATARKKFVSVEICGKEKVEDFAHLMRLTEERKSIKLRDSSYFALLLDTYGKDAKLFLAYIDLKSLLEDSAVRLEKTKIDIEKCKEKDQKKKDSLQQTYDALQKDIDTLSEYQKQDGDKVCVAGALAIVYGDTCEMLYMGMDSKYRRYMAPYLSHLTPMLWSFEHGCRICNMGGVEGSLDDGLTKFKSNFNPDIIEYVGEFDLPVNALLYHGAQTAFKIRKRMLNKH